jgi:hypothetical protein
MPKASTKLSRVAWRPSENADWVSPIGSAQTTVTVVVKQPEMEHKVRMRDFEAWLESNGRSPVRDGIEVPFTRGPKQIANAVRRLGF